MTTLDHEKRIPTHLTHVAGGVIPFHAVHQDGDSVSRIVDAIGSPRQLKVDCVACGTTIETIRRRKFCNKSCRERHKNKLKYRRRKLAPQWIARRKKYDHQYKRARYGVWTPDERICLVCGNWFIQRAPNQIYCHYKCERISRTKLGLAYTCVQCGASCVRQSRRRTYCSDYCSYKAQIERNTRKQIEAKAAFRSLGPILGEPGPIKLLVPLVFHRDAASMSLHVPTPTERPIDDCVGPAVIAGCKSKMVRPQALPRNSRNKRTGRNGREYDLHDMLRWLYSNTGRSATHDRIAMLRACGLVKQTVTRQQLATYLWVTEEWVGQVFTRTPLSRIMFNQRRSFAAGLHHAHLSPSQREEQAVATQAKRRAAWEFMQQILGAKEASYGNEL